MSKETRAATTRSSLRKELAAKMRSTRSSVKLNKLYLIQPGYFQNPTTNIIRQKDLLATKVSNDKLVTSKQYLLTYVSILFRAKRNLKSQWDQQRISTETEDRQLNNCRMQDISRNLSNTNWMMMMMMMMMMMIL
jgi:hypothetical protein